jgi:predicted N-acetyltransferase YhbS
MGYSQIRPARVEETNELTQLAIRAHAVYDADFTARIMPVLKIDPVLIAAELVFVAEDEKGASIGVIALRPLEPAGLFLLEGIFLDPNFARQGIGRRLFESAIARARKLGGCSIIIYANPGAAGFYIRLGAIRIGASPFVFSPDLLLPVFAIPISPIDESGVERCGRTRE